MPGAGRGQVSGAPSLVAHGQTFLGQLDITPEGFAAITRVVANLADELCDGRVVSVLEGGYRLKGLADSVAAHVLVLTTADQR